MGLGLGMALVLTAPEWAGAPWAMDSDRPELNRMAAVAVLMAVWWVTEAVPLAVTSLIPLAAFPFLGILDHKTVANQYFNQNIVLFLAGFLIALAIENSGLHRRIALNIVVSTGNRPALIVLGFMVATALLSMWISNTATTLMMLPIAVGILAHLDAESLNLPPDKRPRGSLAPSLLLGIAYAASLGGNATKVGTLPNIAFASLYEEHYGRAIDFMDWMWVALPISVILVAVTWAWLVFVMFRPRLRHSIDAHKVVVEQLQALGRMRQAEFRALVVLVNTALLWIFREPVEGWGWAPALGYGGVNGLIGDSTPAVLMAILCFVIPSGGQPGEPLLKWSDSVRVPWGVLLLLGGGLALARGLSGTGLDGFLGERLAEALAGQSVLVMMLLSTAGVTTLTELTSNTATLQMIFPLLASTLDQLELTPMLLLMPAAMAVNCAFMLPVATPPNAIVYGSGRIHMRQMVAAGVMLNILAVLVIVAVIWLMFR